MAKRHRALWLLVVLALVYGGCKEKDTPFTTDVDEIKSLLTKSEMGRDLFRWDSLVIPTDYTVPYDDGTCRDSMLSHRRTIDVAINSKRVYYWYPRGSQTEATATVTDEFTIQTRRVYSDTTIVDTTDRDITRYAFLLRLGGSGDLYKGWYLWGYNGGGSTSIFVTVDPAGGTSFPGDGDIYHQIRSANADFTADSSYTFGGATYLQYDEIPVITDGEDLAIAAKSKFSGTVKRPLVRISAADENGNFSRNMIRIDRNNSVDTIRTPTVNPRIWNIVLLDTFHDTEFFYTGSHVFAFRVPVTP